MITLAASACWSCSLLLGAGAPSRPGEADAADAAIDADDAVADADAEKDQIDAGDDADSLDAWRPDTIGVVDARPDADAPTDAEADADADDVPPDAGDDADEGEEEHDCPCDGPMPEDEEFDNFCHHAPSTDSCPMTFPGGYCDPNGNGRFEDAEWAQGWHDYDERCG